MARGESKIRVCQPARKSFKRQHGPEGLYKWMLRAKRSCFAEAQRMLLLSMKNIYKLNDCSKKTRTVCL